MQKNKNRLYLRAGDDYLTLSVKGYEACGYAEVDDAWLCVSGNVHVAGDSLCGVDPCLQTSELSELYSRFKQLKNGAITELFYCVIEQNLWFRCNTKLKLLEIYYFPEKTLCHTFSTYADVIKYQQSKKHVVFRKRLADKDVTKILAWLRATLEEFSPKDYTLSCISANTKL